MDFNAYAGQRILYKGKEQSWRAGYLASISSRVGNLFGNNKSIISGVISIPFVYRYYNTFPLILQGLFKKPALKRLILPECRNFNLCKRTRRNI